MILIVDNYDSFTYNLVHLLAPFGEALEVVRNDALSARDAVDLKPSAIILSPGPCTPNEAGICLALAELAAEEDVPLLGVCLGHQAIAQRFGGEVVPARTPMHGKVSKIRHDGDPLFAGIPNPFTAARYHSLSVSRAASPTKLKILAEAEDDGQIMALKVEGTRTYGVQYHPESHASAGGGQLMANFLRLADVTGSAAA